jgi:hypothetical protein
VTSTPSIDAANRYRVVIRDEGTDQRVGWVVTILDPDGREVSRRACRDETEANTFASTVRQHAGWLSEGRFRENYRIPQGT